MAKPNPELRNERVRSAQGGIETTAIPYLWLKASLFRHEIRDGFSFMDFPDGTFTTVNTARERVQGVELEAKTTPVYNTSLAGGILLVSARDRDTGEKISFRPSTTYNVSLKYKNRHAVLAMLTGHYVTWAASPDYAAFGGDPSLKNSFIWDFHASKALGNIGKVNAELFLSVRNIFNDKQYTYYIPDLRIPDRWAEAGVRMRF